MPIHKRLSTKDKKFLTFLSPSLFCSNIKNYVEFYNNKFYDITVPRTGITIPCYKHWTYSHFLRKIIDSHCLYYCFYNLYFDTIMEMDCSFLQGYPLWKLVSGPNEHGHGLSIYSYKLTYSGLYEIYKISKNLQE